MIADWRLLHSGKSDGEVSSDRNRQGYENTATEIDRSSLSVIIDFCGADLGDFDSLELRFNLC